MKRAMLALFGLCALTSASIAEPFLLGLLDESDPTEENLVAGKSVRLRERGVACFDNSVAIERYKVPLFLFEWLQKKLIAKGECVSMQDVSFRLVQFRGIVRVNGSVACLVEVRIEEGSAPKRTKMNRSSAKKLRDGRTLFLAWRTYSKPLYRTCDSSDI